ncbi:hypothetical protein AB0B01_22605 [Streptomyces sp. NPDC044571]|uniref:hypothetical protein n=1 Tax=Streptomyces sp. NPDC044571 TaxID=3155371 RepID=UPI0033D258F7
MPAAIGIDAEPDLPVAGAVPDTFAGRWTADRGLLLTVIAVPAAEQHSGPGSTRTA